MKADDEICCCFHVSLRKLVHFARRERPARESQMSDCLNAGTGCGWCIPILKMLHQKANEETLNLSENADMEGLPATPEDYVAARKDYLQSDRKNTFE
ncbi:MAG: (2Fe-2S)-binding protein [Planctomycetes bacterium]|nr:(2Fe-2S)-binding protein [Planctomycetota bacterium]